MWNFGGFIILFVWPRRFFLGGGGGGGGVWLGEVAECFCTGNCLDCCWQRFTFSAGK